MHTLQPLNSLRYGPAHLIQVVRFQHGYSVEGASDRLRRQDSGVREVQRLDALVHGLRVPNGGLNEDICTRHYFRTPSLCWSSWQPGCVAPLRHYSTPSALGMRGEQPDNVRVRLGWAEGLPGHV
ncbi:hypothetical protein LCGC14_2126830, partial [marine sediment metagenome]